MATLIGKVGMVMKGNWSSSATYEALDAVSYNGGLYVAKMNVPANTAPTNTTYWQAGSNAANIVNTTLPAQGTVNVTAYKGAVIVIGRAATGKKGLAIIDSASAVCELMNISEITYSLTGNTLTITSTLSGSVGVTVMNPVQ